MVRLSRDVMDPATFAMGEVFVHIRDSNGRSTRLENRVSQPHLWEATLFYLTAMAMSDPMRFDPTQRALPDARIPAPGSSMDAGVRADGSTTPPPTTGGGCGCRTTNASGHAGASLLLLGLLATGRRRRGARAA
jgi:MYXO-CTERM domain-containing protein